MTPDDVDRAAAGRSPPTKEDELTRDARFQEDFCILRRSSGSRGSTCAPGTSSRASSPACTAVPYFGQSVEFVPAPRIHPRRRPAPRRLEGLGQEGPLLRQAVRGRHQPALHAAGRRLGQHALRPRGAEQVRVRLHHRRLPGLPAAAAAGRRGLHAFDETSAMTVPAAHQAEPPRLDRPGPGRQRARAKRPTSTRSCATWPRRYPRRGMIVLISDLLVDREGLVPRPEAAAAPRPRRAGLPRPGRRRAGFPLQRPHAVRGPGAARASALQSPRAARGLSEALDEYLDEVRRGCARHNVDYALLRTSQPLDAALAAFLSNRLGNAP